MKKFSYPPKSMIDDIERQFGGEFESYITYEHEDGRPTYNWKRKENK